MNMTTVSLWITLWKLGISLQYESHFTIKLHEKLWKSR